MSEMTSDQANVVVLRGHAVARPRGSGPAERVDPAPLRGDDPASRCGSRDRAGRLDRSGAAAEAARRRRGGGRREGPPSLLPIRGSDAQRDRGHRRHRRTGVLARAGRRGRSATRGPASPAAERPVRDESLDICGELGTVGTTVAGRPLAAARMPGAAPPTPNNRGAPRSGHREPLGRRRRRSPEPRVQDHPRLRPEPPRSRLHRACPHRQRPIPPGAAQPPVAVRPWAPGRQRLRVDPARRSGHRALGCGEPSPPTPSTSTPATSSSSPSKAAATRWPPPSGCSARSRAASPTASRSSSSSTTTSC